MRSIRGRLVGGVYVSWPTGVASAASATAAPAHVSHASREAITGAVPRPTWLHTRAPAVITALGAGSGATSLLSQITSVKRAAKRLRDSSSALCASNVPAAAGAMSLEQLGEAAGVLARTASVPAAARSSFNAYAQYVTSSTTAATSRRAPLPVTLETLSAFAMHRVLVARSARGPTAGDIIKSSGLAKTLTQIKTLSEGGLVPDEAFQGGVCPRWLDGARWHVSSRTQWTLSATEWDASLKIADQLAKSVPATRKPTSTLSLLHLRSLYDYCDEQGTPESLRLWAYVAVSVAMQARGNEMVDDDGYLQFGDLRLDLDCGLGAVIVLDKTHKAEFINTPRVGLHLPARLGWLCAKAALLRFLTTASSWTASWSRDTLRRRWPVFPSFGTGTARPSAGAATTRARRYTPHARALASRRLTCTWADPAATTFTSASASTTLSSSASARGRRMPSTLAARAL